MLNRFFLFFSTNITNLLEWRVILSLHFPSEEVKLSNKTLQQEEQPGWTDMQQMHAADSQYTPVDHGNFTLFLVLNLTLTLSWNKSLPNTASHRHMYFPLHIGSNCSLKLQFYNKKLRNLKITKLSAFWHFLQYLHTCRIIPRRIADTIKFLLFLKLQKHAYDLLYKKLLQMGCGTSAKCAKMIIKRWHDGSVIPESRARVPSYSRSDTILFNSTSNQLSKEKCMVGSRY